MKWGLGRKAQWLVEGLNTLSTFLVAQFANWRGGRSSEALRVQSSRLAISTEAAPGSSLVRAEVSTADLANWCDRPHVMRVAEQAQGGAKGKAGSSKKDSET